MSRNNHNLDQTTKDTHSDEIERVFFNGTTLAERTTSYLSDQKPLTTSPHCLFTFFNGQNASGKKISTSAADEGQTQTDTPKP